jgi:hypothetical protein
VKSVLRNNTFGTCGTADAMDCFVPQSNGKRDHIGIRRQGCKHCLIFCILLKLQILWNVSANSLDAECEGGHEIASLGYLLAQLFVKH